MESVCSGYSCGYLAGCCAGHCAGHYAGRCYPGLSAPGSLVFLRRTHQHALAPSSDDQTYRGQGRFRRDLYLSPAWHCTLDSDAIQTP